MTIISTLRQAVIRWWYEYISTLDRDAHMLFMNYGFAHLNGQAAPLELHPADEPHRYPLQLYHHIASAVEWTGVNVLEVGAGRGGGAHYLARHFKPRSLVGIDITANAVNFCQRQYALNTLAFSQADAQRLPFPAAAFDIVLNVESSLYYPNFDQFLSEVVRVLKPNGHFLYADIRYRREMARWQAQLRHPHLEWLKAEDITPNVVRALELDYERKETLIARYAPRVLRRVARHFAGQTGAKLANGRPHAQERVYWNFVFRKMAI